MFARVLIANRGEIACRIIQTCRRLGITSIAVYSEADSNARHVRLADESICIGGPASLDSYLNIRHLMDAVRETGAEAVHPGYGFLSENPALARACARAKVAFVGPAPSTMEKMGAKADAKRLMEAAGVPTVPGYHGKRQDDESLAREADKIGYPLMIKASAGGGGKGMRIAHDRADFASRLNAARREARGAFDDDVMILERYLQHPRHIEFQIVGDHDGCIVHLFERECSIQRRYQKIIEETPSPFLDEETRRAMSGAAVDAGHAVDYVGAGTVEFIVDSDLTFYFMEMNTRLQVEHPVTEMTTGVDLVEWQLRIAAGEALPLKQEEIERRGHAIEARLYAEDPERDFLPSSGHLSLVVFPETGPRVRVDTAVETEDSVSVHYDPMIAKIVVHHEQRDGAIAALVEALADTAVFGCRTNLAFLERVARLDAFRAGRIDTGFVDQHLDALKQPGSAPASAGLVAAATGLLAQEAASRRATLESTDPFSPWGIADAWRLNHPGHRLMTLVPANGEQIQVNAQGHAGHYVLNTPQGRHRMEMKSAGRHRYDVLLDDTRFEARCYQRDAEVEVLVPGGRFRFSEFSPYDWAAEHETGENRLTAPMPGKIVSVHVKEGDRVAQGDELVIMEAMKIEITLRAPHAAQIDRIVHSPGDFVEADVTLVELSDTGE